MSSMAAPASRAWCELSPRLAVSDAEVRCMLLDLWRLLGPSGLSATLGVPLITLECLRARRTRPAAPFRRLIWLNWCIFFHPERCATLLDLVTWGRLHEPAGYPVNPAPIKRRRRKVPSATGNGAAPGSPGASGVAG